MSLGSFDNLSFAVWCPNNIMVAFATWVLVILCVPNGRNVTWHCQLKALVCVQSAWNVVKQDSIILQVWHRNDFHQEITGAVLFLINNLIINPSHLIYVAHNTSEYSVGRYKWVLGKQKYDSDLVKLLECHDMKWHKTGAHNYCVYLGYVSIIML